MGTNTLIDLFTRHRIAANLAMIMMVLAGLWAADRINTQLNPTVRSPVVFVDIHWRGASAEDVAQLVVDPIEQKLRNMDHLQEMTSTSHNGGGYVRLEYAFDANMSEVLDAVKDRIAQIRNLPADMDPLRIRRATDYEETAAVLVTSDGSLQQLAPVVRKMRRELLSAGIDRIDFEGMPDDQIAIQVPSAKLIALHTSLDRIASEVRERSSDTPAGSIGLGQGERQLRSLGQQRTAAGFRQLEVALQPGGRLTRLGDIATVQRRPKLGEPLLTKNGKVAIEMNLYRLTNHDAIKAADILHRWLERTRATLPAGMHIDVFSEAWVLLRQQLDVIFDNGLSGLLLVIATLFLFLNGRVGLWVTVGIPVSFLFGTLLYYAVFHGSINILALITFVMALGIIVDDAIVVGEDSMTLFEQGLSPMEAALGGAKRMFLPVVASSLTTLAAFVPLLITGGELGQIIETMPTVFLCVVIASLVECFLVLPGHLRHSFAHIDRNRPGRFRLWFDAKFRKLRDEYYRPLLELALRYPGATLGGAFASVVLAFSLVASGRVGVNFVSGMSIESLEANVEFSGGATQADKKKFMAELESTLNATNAEFGNKDLNGYVTEFNTARLNRQRKSGSQYGSLDVAYAWQGHRNVSPQKFVDAWRQKIVRMPYVEQLHIKVAGGANNGMPDISLVLRGHDIPTLKRASEALQHALAGYQGVSNIYDDLPYGRDQIVFSLTPSGKALGLTTEALGRQLRAAYSGRRVQVLDENDTEVDVMVMLPNKERENLASLRQFPVRTPSGQLVPLDMVATLSNRRGIDVINHNDGEMSVVVNASVDPKVNNAQKILADVRAHALKQIKAKYGLSSGLSGITRQNQEIVQTMSKGAVLTLIFIYLILAWSFGSYAWPLAVMTAIPLGLTGAILGHWIMGIDIGTMSLLAFFALTGIVVNDSIVLIDFFRRGLESGLTVKEAIREAALSRFRAVLLTSLTTVAGLVSLMFETFSLALYMVPIAVTICFGLGFATMLILLVVPSLIVMIEDVHNRMEKTRSRLAGEDSRELTV